MIRAGNLLLAAGILLLALADASARDSDGAEGGVPVLVELFTSEGCSSCPPADRFLEVLQREQPVPGAEIITLSEHVDYWNRLGWSDPYSSESATSRQAAYSRNLPGDGMYTPQIVVDGQVGLVGGDRRQVLQAIADATRRSRIDVELTLQRPGPDGSAIPVRIRVSELESPPLCRPCSIMLAVAENGLAVEVTRGENSGRTLEHVSVVRQMIEIGVIRGASDGPWIAERVVDLDPEWKKHKLKFVAFVQRAEGGPVLGVDSVGLARQLGSALVDPLQLLDRGVDDEDP